MATRCAEGTYVRVPLEVLVDEPEGRDDGYEGKETGYDPPYIMRYNDPTQTHTISPRGRETRGVDRLIAPITLHIPWNTTLPCWNREGPFSEALGVKQVALVDMIWAANRCDIKERERERERNSTRQKTCAKSRSRDSGAESLGVVKAKMNDMGHKNMI